MKVPGLEVPRLFRAHPAPWRLDEEHCAVRDASGVELPDVTGALWRWGLAAPLLAEALVSVTQALVDGLEVHAPGIDPLKHPCVEKALAALAKARGEAL